MVLRLTRFEGSRGLERRQGAGSRVSGDGNACCYFWSSTNNNPFFAGIVIVAPGFQVVAS